MFSPAFRLVPFSLSHRVSILQGEIGNWSVVKSLGENTWEPSQGNFVSPTSRTSYFRKGHGLSTLRLPSLQPVVWAPKNRLAFLLLWKLWAEILPQFFPTVDIIVLLLCELGLYLTTWYLFCCLTPTPRVFNIMSYGLKMKKLERCFIDVEHNANNAFWIIS